MKKSFIFLLILSLFIARAQTESPNADSVTQLEQRYRESKQRPDSKATADAAVLAAEAHLQAANYKRSIDFLLVAKDIYKKSNDSENLAKVSCRLAENYYRSGNVKRYKDYIALAGQLIGKDTLNPAYLLLIDTQIGYFKARKKHPQVRYLTDRRAKLQAAKEGQMQTTPKDVAQKKTIPATPPAVVPKAVVKPKNNVPPFYSNTNGLGLALAVTIAALAVVALIYFFYRDNRRQLDQRRQQNETQAQLLKNLSLAIRVASNGKVDELSHQLAQLSEINSGEKKPNFAMEPIGPFLASVTAPFMQQAAGKNVAVISNVEQKNDAELIDRKTVATIVKILFSEALIHAEAGQTIYFSATVEKRKLELRVSYQSDPIDKEHLQTIFENLYHEPSGQHPNPIGFALTGALVSWYDGSAEANYDGNLLRIAVQLPLSEPAHRKPKHVPTVVL